MLALVRNGVVLSVIDGDDGMDRVSGMQKIPDGIRVQIGDRYTNGHYMRNGEYLKTAVEVAREKIQAVEGRLTKAQYAELMEILK